MTHHSPPTRSLKLSIFIPAVLLFCSLTALFAWATTETVYYRYDNTYQIKKVAYTNFTTTYSYDEAGNLISVTTNPPDIIPPASYISYPVSSQVLTNTTSTISGTATDWTGSGVSEVEVSTDGGINWNNATGTTSWSYEWTNIPSAGPHTIKSRATDYTFNVQTSTSTVNVTAKSSLSCTRSGININYNLARPGTMTKFKVTSQPWSVDGSTASTKSWLQVSPANGTTPSDIVLNIDSAGLVARNYTGTVIFTSAYGNNSPLRVPVSLTVVPASALTPENQHYNWDGSLTGGNCNICHTSRNAFLPSDYDIQNYEEFCISCHNKASRAHDRGDNSTVHSIMVNVTSGGNMWPTYGNITAAERNNQPFSRLKNGNALVCETCHNSMGKYEDYGRVWEMTSTSDRYTYYVSEGGWANYGQLVPTFYRTTSIMSAPTYSKSRKAYVVKPSEYTYDETAGSITFLVQQSTTSYIYVTLDYPYLRASSEQNRLCSDCHTQATHKEDNCLVCHQAHNATNVGGIRRSVRTSDLSDRTVNFKRYTGANSFADGDTTYDGICEVCHTQTKYYKRDGSGFANHSGNQNYNEQNCSTCHRHKEGFSKYTTSAIGQQFGEEGEGLEYGMPEGFENSSIP